MKKWSSQWTQFMQLCKEAWKKKFRTSTGFEPMISRYRCDALPTELWSHWQWEQVNCGFIFSSERNECNNIFVVPHLVSKTLIITKVVWQFCIWLRWRSKGQSCWHLAPGASLVFSRSLLSRSLFSRRRKQSPWSKFWIIFENYVVSYTPLVSRSSYKQFQAISKWF